MLVAEKEIQVGFADLVLWSLGEESLYHVTHDMAKVSPELWESGSQGTGEPARWEGSQWDGELGFL